MTVRGTAQQAAGRARGWLAAAIAGQRPELPAAVEAAPVRPEMLDASDGLPRLVIVQGADGTLWSRPYNTNLLGATILAELGNVAVHEEWRKELIGGQEGT